MVKISVGIFGKFSAKTPNLDLLLGSSCQSILRKFKIDKFFGCRCGTVTFSKLQSHCFLGMVKIGSGLKNHREIQVHDLFLFKEISDPVCNVKKILDRTARQRWNGRISQLHLLSNFKAILEEFPPSYSLLWDRQRQAL